MIIPLRGLFLVAGPYHTVVTNLTAILNASKTRSMVSGHSWETGVVWDEGGSSWDAERTLFLDVGATSMAVFSL